MRIPNKRLRREAPFRVHYCPSCGSQNVRTDERNTDCITCGLSFRVVPSGRWMQAQEIRRWEEEGEADNER